MLHPPLPVADGGGGAAHRPSRELKRVQVDTIGRYEILQRIGSGGFATVYRARDPVLDSQVAVKVLADNWAGNPEIHDRFIREAQLLRRIDSDRVVTVHDIGELPNGQPYFVMALADRGTLEDRLRPVLADPAADSGGDAAPPAADQVLTVARAMADCITVVHSHGLIHRDIKPGNLLVTGPRLAVQRAPADILAPGERLVLGDFGLAKDIALHNTGLTIAAGSGGYAAPEQMTPVGSPDERTDLFAATAVMYRVIAGTRPPGYEGGQRTAAYPDGWWMAGALGRFFGQGMAYDQADRYDSVDLWLAELTAAVTQAHIPSSVTDPPPVLPGSDAASPLAPVPLTRPADPASEAPPGAPGSPPALAIRPPQAPRRPSEPAVAPPAPPGSSEPGFPLPVRPGPPGPFKPAAGVPAPPGPPPGPGDRIAAPPAPAVAAWATPAASIGAPAVDAGGPAEPGPTPTAVGTADPSGAGSAEPAGSRGRGRVALAVVLAVLVLAGLVLVAARVRRERGPVITGPAQITAGGSATYQATSKGAASYEWTDPNGQSRTIDQLTVRGVVPGVIRVSVVAVTADGKRSAARTRSVEVVAAADGPVITGPDTVTVGQVATYTFSGVTGTNPTWIDPDGKRHPGRQFQVTAQSPGSYRIVFVITRPDGTQIGAARDVTLAKP